LALSRAAVTAYRVAVVATLIDHDSVAALRDTTLVTTSRFVEALGAASVKGHRVAVVATLSAFDLLVAASGRNAPARISGTLVSELDLAGFRTAVTRGSIAVVAQLRHDRDTIAAPRNAVAGSARRNARETRLDLHTIGQATIARFSIAVIAGLVLSQFPVSAIGRRGHPAEIDPAGGI
jgi:hypothetical protein